MKHFKSGLLFIAVLFLFNYSAYAQDTSKKFSFDVGIGNSYIPAQSNYSPWGMEYRTNYRSGLQINSRLLFIFNNKTTFGAKYSMFSSGANYLLEENNLIENLSINYFAPQIGHLYVLNPKFSILYNVGAGYAHYQSNGLKETGEYNIKSNILGANADVSLYYNLSKSTAIGFTPSFFTSINAKNLVKTENDVTRPIIYDKWKKLNLSRLDFSLNLRVSF